MKNQTLILLIAFMAIAASAQTQTLNTPEGTVGSNSTKNYVGIGTSTPKSPLHLYDGVNRDYYVNRVIPGSTEDASAGGANYILLHLAYNGTVIGENYVMGRISGTRGGTAAWNRKISMEVNTASAYNDNRGSLLSYNEGVRLVTVTYNSQRYVAVEIAHGSSVSYWSFSGYAKNELFTLVYDQNVSNVLPFTAAEIDPVRFDGQAAVFHGASGGPSNASAIDQGLLISGHSTGGALNLGIDAAVGFYSWIQSRDRGSATFYNLALNPSGGNVGIGITNPGARLDVVGGTKVGNTVASPAYTDHLIVRTDGNVAYEGGQIFTNVDNTSGYGIKLSASYSVANDPGFRMGVVNLASPNTYTREYLFFKGGFVGIGTITPDAELTVDGVVHTEEVKVDLNVPGPDYVFEPDYKLLSLEEIEKYVKENKHLPEVPSAKEMEANGVKLLEMNMLLLKKVEELTLLMIEMKKEVQEAKHNAQDANAKVDAQQAMIDKLKESGK